jgi:hypothetical protein
LALQDWRGDGRLRNPHRNGQAPRKWWNRIGTV